jgi:phage-related protein
LSIVVSAQDKASSKLASLGEKIGGTFAKVGLGAAAAGAAIGAMAVASIKKFSDVGGAIQDMADRTGLATESISALRVAAQLNGTAIETVEAAVKKMTLQNLNAATSSDALKSAIAGVGGSISDLANMTPDQQFELLANAISHTADTQERARLATEAFGKAGGELLPMFASGSFSMAEFNAQAEKLGVNFSPERAAAAAAFGDAMDSVKMALDGVALTVGGALAPYLTKLMEDVIIPLSPIIQKLVTGALNLLASAFQWVYDKAKLLLEKLKETGVITAFQNAFQMVADAFTESLWPAIQQVWLALTPWFPLFESIAKVVGIVVIGAVLLLVVAFAALIQIVGGIIGKIAEFIAKVSDDLKPVLDVMKDGIDNISNTVMKMVGWFNSAISAIDRFLEKARQVSGAISGGVMSIISGGSSKKRALGGPVTAGRQYLVGERGPELFTPVGGGSITPNNALGGGGGVSVGVSINVGSVSNDVDVRRMAQQVGDILLGKLQSNMGI